jgi:hypothetical protein
MFQSGDRSYVTTGGGAKEFFGFQKTNFFDFSASSSEKANRFVSVFTDDMRFV